MKKSKFTEEQIAYVLRQVRRRRIPDAARGHPTSRPRSNHPPSLPAAHRSRSAEARQRVGPQSDACGRICISMFLPCQVPLLRII